MKKNTVTCFLAAVIFITLFIFACDTKDDPSLPNHAILSSTSSTSTTGGTAASNTIVFGANTFPLLTHGCLIDSNYHNYYMFAGTNNNAGINLYVIIPEISAPTSSKNYSLVSINDTLNANEAIINVEDPNNVWTSTKSTGGIFTVTVSGSNITGSFSGVTLTKFGGTDTKVTSANISCQ